MIEPGKITIGTAVFPTASFTDDTGLPANPTTVTFKTISPSGTLATYTYGSSSVVTRPETGTYKAEIYPDEPGRWHTRWEATGNKMAVEDNFTVQASPFYDFAARRY